MRERYPMLHFFSIILQRIDAKSAAALSMTCVFALQIINIQTNQCSSFSLFSCSPETFSRAFLFGDDKEVSFRLNCVVVMEILLQKQPGIHMIWLNSAAESLKLCYYYCGATSVYRGSLDVCISRRIIMTSCVFKPHLLALRSFKAVWFSF